MPIRKNEPYTALNQRDWVAVMALQGILANSDYVKGSDLRRDVTVAARKAYDLADAMITVSEIGEKGGKTKE
jgi:hypothetical protein